MYAESVGSRAFRQSHREVQEHVQTSSDETRLLGKLLTGPTTRLMGL